MAKIDNAKTYEHAYEQAKDIFALLGVDTDEILNQLQKIPVSMHCWQGDDVGGFEGGGDITDGGIMATGDYPGKPGNADELRRDIETALSLVPGKHRLNLHAIYAETNGKKVDRNELEPTHFKNWCDWAKEQELGLDFNPSCFAHPMVKEGLTLASRDPNVRNFWIEHCIASRKIGEYFGKELNTACITNVWIPDGYKDTPADRYAPREILKQALDKVFAEKIDPKHNKDTVESKLFGIGSESYVVGSFEFYLGYAIEKNVLLTLDSGHFHPTESIADKISSVLLYIDEIMLHISRGVRWDSDHIVTLNDDSLAIARAVIQNGFQSRVHAGTDFFDASVNRIAAWIIGMRSVLKAYLNALLEPSNTLKEAEKNGNLTKRLAMMEDIKSLPSGAIWNYYCLKNNVPPDGKWLEKVEQYEKEVLLKR
ncbi:L-rhamnose isomerase [candidate division KSB1 bacterium]|nr:L-rhamnose isomerase [candidate division KSB1 bacterium]